MSSHLLRRLTTTFLVVVSLLFSQMALATYVCPGQADAAAMARMMASGAPCTGMDEVQPLLCHQYGAAPAQSFEPAKLPSASVPAIVQVLEVPLVLENTAKAAARPVSASAEARPPPDPVYLSTLRLRV